MRRMIREADPDAVESIKWRKAGNPSGVPVWEHAGILCTGETYKQYIKLTFARGASLDDPEAAVQFQPDGRHPPRDRHPRR